MQLLRAVAVLALCLAAPAAVCALDNGLALTPQMGWNTWNRYGCNINEDLVIKSAEALQSTGLASLGYMYINLDDCWQVDRGMDGSIIADPTNFANGIASLSAHIHQLGLKIGLYSDAGTNTCQGRPGGLNYEKIDAKTYSDWRIDYLKYDNCYDNGIEPQLRYPRMRDALNATKWPILFSMCEWGVNDPATWAGDMGNSWRTTDDIRDEWDSMLSNLDQNDKWWNYSGSGHWNDPDMLEVGNGGMTTVEYQSHFSLWALVKAPLIIGCDVTNMTQDTLNILSNKEVIAVNQDPLGVQGHKVYSNNSLEVWSGPLSGNETVVILFNRGNASANISAHWSLIGVSNGASVTVRDLWLHQDLGVFNSSIVLPVESHGVRMLKLTPKASATSIDTTSGAKHRSHARLAKRLDRH